MFFHAFTLFQNDHSYMNNKLVENFIFIFDVLKILQITLITVKSNS